MQLLSQELIEYEKNIEKEKEYIYVVCYKNEIIGYMTCWVNKQEKWDKYKTFEIGNLAGRYF